jgi:hypothetical protein
MDLQAVDNRDEEHVAMLRRLEAKMRARRSLNESWCGHLNVTDVLCLPSHDRWVAGCDDCFKDSSETHPESDYVYSVPAKDVLDREGLIDWLDHLTEKGWFIPGFDSFLDAVSFARAVHRRTAVAPAQENLHVVKWPSDNDTEDGD